MALNTERSPGAAGWPPPDDCAQESMKERTRRVTPSSAAMR